ncbi:MAG: alpha/beta hydrolase [Candidatus Heimdallarchaeota archaeon]|nr:alpha/beta hydrolase [Candidatus Heimdallarchaeota archaeon]
MNVFIPKHILKEKEPLHPLPPKIENLEALAAQNELNALLKREDISANALPSEEKKPIVLLLHGYGSSKWLYIEPYFGTFGWLRDYRFRPKPKSYGWHSKPPPSHMYLPFAYSISPTLKVEGLFVRLMRKRIDVITYSQKEPFGDINLSANELKEILDGIKRVYGERRILVVGHSRGGICIRKYLEQNKNELIEKAIFLGTPHRGTNLTNLFFLKQPLIKLLNESNLKRFWDIAGRRRVTSLKPEQLSTNSKFLLDLKDREQTPNVKYIFIAGNCATYAHIYSWKIGQTVTKRTIKHIFSTKEDDAVNIKNNEEKKKEKVYHWLAKPKKILTIFEGVLLPEFAQGDGMVSLKSALYGEADEKIIFNVNHEELAVCEPLERKILKELKNFDPK